MGVLFPTQRVVLESPLAPEGLRAAVRRVPRRPPAARRPSEPERWMLGEAEGREVLLQPAPRLEDVQHRASWGYVSVAEWAAAVEPRGARSALVGTLRVREQARLRLLPVLAGVPGAIALLLVVLAAPALGREGAPIGALLRGLGQLLLVPASIFLFFRFLVDAAFERDRRTVIRLLREELAAAEGEAGGQADPEPGHSA